MAKKNANGVAGCNPAQSQHLIKIIEGMNRRAVKLPPRSPARKLLENKIKALEDKIKALEDKIAPLRAKLGIYQQKDRDITNSVEGRIRSRVSEVRSAILFKSRDEAMAAVDAFVAEFEPLVLPTNRY